MRLARFVFAISLLPGVLPAQDTAQLARTGQQALSDGAYTTAVYFLKQVVAAEPKHASAWETLGRAYLALDRVDAAIDACLKQIDVHPESPAVYGTLGRALWRKGKRDDAIDAFRQQIEVDPHNSSAHGDLGRLYCELGRYADAVPELEKAVTMEPRSSVYQGGLGDAYLGLGQIDRGMGALDKLVQDNPSAGTWNTVAHQLASHKLQLERAQRYAESAVTIVAADLRNVEVDRISIPALRLVVSLASYWDTLGWVHFQRGNLDEAGKFIQASWSANPRGPAGDHLGQLYASRGQKQEAIQAFSRALAAPGALPETRHRLEALVSAGETDPLIQRAGGELVSARTLPAGKLFAEKAAADFYVAQAAVPAIVEARFIRGDDALRPFTKTVQDVTPAGIFPDATPAKLIRRVTLTCPGEGGECSIELQPASAAVFAELNAIPPNTHFAVEPLSGKPGVYRVGGGVTPPVPIYRPEPEYTKEARKKKIQGAVILYLEVDSTGHPRNIKVMRRLGLGLDEKAVEAVSKWEFRPGMKDGKPVTVAATVEVNFRLLKDH
jgi:TonB family protein